MINSFTTTINDENGERTVVIYPVEYAGAYIDHSNNLHVVLSKYATNTTVNTYCNIMGNDPDIIFETAEFPLSSLYELQDALVGAPFRFDKACVNITSNRIEINLPDGTDQKEVTNYFKMKFTDFDVSCINFLGPCPITGGIDDINSPAVTLESNDGFLGTNIPSMYVVVAFAIVAVTIAFACYLTFVRGSKPA